MILCSGCFDGLHRGHVRYLQHARALDRTQTLRVAIAPDDYIRQTKQREPYWPHTDRADTVFALGCVDSVIMQRSMTVAPIILEYKPALFVKGEDWRDRLPEDVLEACQRVGAQVVYVETPGRHVTEARCSS